VGTYQLNGAFVEAAIGFLPWERGTPRKASRCFTDTVLLAMEHRVPGTLCGMAAEHVKPSHLTGVHYSLLAWHPRHAMAKRCANAVAVMKRGAGHRCKQSWGTCSAGS
jgi:hypothetical protein